MESFIPSSYVNVNSIPNPKGIGCYNSILIIRVGKVGIVMGSNFEQEKNDRIRVVF